MVEYHLVKVGVGGSSPLFPTTEGGTRSDVFWGGTRLLWKVYCTRGLVYIFKSML